MLTFILVYAKTMCCFKGSTEQGIERSIHMYGLCLIVPTTSSLYLI